MGRPSQPSKLESRMPGIRLGWAWLGKKIKKTMMSQKTTKKKKKMMTTMEGRDKRRSDGDTRRSISIGRWRELTKEDSFSFPGNYEVFHFLSDKCFI